MTEIKAIENEKKTNTNVLMCNRLENNSHILCFSCTFLKPYILPCVKGRRPLKSLVKILPLNKFGRIHSHNQTTPTELCFVHHFLRAPRG